MQTRTDHLQLAALPSHIEYNILTLTTPTGQTTTLPRRELFDIRRQLLAEADSDSSSLPSGIDTSDIHTNIYEGGFKTWECSLDLARYLLSHTPSAAHIIELGAGTSLPSCLLFQHALTHDGVLTHLTLADYNPTVLTHATLPNLLLTYASTLPATESPFSTSDPNPLAPGPDFSPESILALSPALLDSFRTALTTRNIELTLLSGSWSLPEYLPCIPAPTGNTLILASETIYSPAALVSFSQILRQLLSRVGAGRALVAAKKMYFGVGGGVDEFQAEAARRGMASEEVEFEELGKGGVRRCVVEVRLGATGQA